MNSYEAVSVSALNTKIKSLLEATFLGVRVEGEVSHATYHSSGHLYFSIKDAKSTLRCVMWRSSVAKMKFRIEKGVRIVVEGAVTLYTPRGEYQLQVGRIEPYGEGALALAYQQLKERLKAKGYFDPNAKKPIPKKIDRVALVTAKASAGLHDMLKILQRRWAMVEVLVVDTLVQGDQGATSIANALAFADSLEVDLVIVGRGGGSSEDLWCFNEERVADAIFAMKHPVISAVGHEVDVLISDLVADLRAPTPSASIEMSFPDANEVRHTLAREQERFGEVMYQVLQRSLSKVVAERRVLESLSPKRKLQEQLLQIKALRSQYDREIAHRIDHDEREMGHLRTLYRQQMHRVLKRRSDEVVWLSKQLHQNDPKCTMTKGWSQASKEGRRVALMEIEESERFFLVDQTTRLEALCITKKSL
jgi:exodeoxyribonuclease VII large subunit